jgi:hypothetical protein
MLADANDAFKRGTMAEASPVLTAELARLQAELVAIPDDLLSRVRLYLESHREVAWDKALEAITKEPQG